MPSIIFVPSRKRCDQAASDVAFDKSQKIDIEKQILRIEIYDEFVKDNPEIRRHKHRKILLRSGVASHHAGHIPAWKFLIEKMMSKGLVNALFATSTVAAGVDFPARSVVVSNADARGNDGWRPLEASELQQMTGRAGRRGKDNVGFVVLAPSNFQNPPRIAKLLQSPPDPLESKFRATYSSLLNLLDAFGGFEPVHDIAEKSFAFRRTARKITKLEKEIEIRQGNIRKTLDRKDLGVTFDDAKGFERLLSARTRQQESIPITRNEMRNFWLKNNIQSGQIISKGKRGKQFLLVMSVYGDMVSTIKENGHGLEVPINRIHKVYEKRYPMNEDSIEKAFLDIYEGRNSALEEPKSFDRSENTDTAIDLLDSLVESLIPESLDADLVESAQELLWETWNDSQPMQKSIRNIAILKNEIWLPFENRARVLDYFGYLDFSSQKVSNEGKWLADLRIDRPLLIGEILKEGIFEKLDISQIAGLMAAFAADADRDYGNLPISEDLLDTLKNAEVMVHKVTSIERRFQVVMLNEINYSAAAAAENWTKGMSWADVVWETRAEEGDLVRLFSRTGEALIQVANLRNSKPEAASIARKTSEVILREPIR